MIRIQVLDIKIERWTAGVELDVCNELRFLRYEYDARTNTATYRILRLLPTGYATYVGTFESSTDSKRSILSQ